LFISLILSGLISYNWYSSNQKFKIIDKKLESLDAKQITLSDNLNKEKENNTEIIEDNRLYKNTNFIPTHNLNNLDKTVKTNLFNDTDKKLEFEYPADWSKPKYVEPQQLNNNISSKPLWQLDIARENPNPIDLTTTTQERQLISGYTYILATYPLEDYTNLQEKLNNYSYYTLEKFNLKGNDGFYTTSGGTCVGQEAYIFSPKNILYLSACDSRDNSQNDPLKSPTMDLILSSLKFTENK